MEQRRISEYHQDIGSSTVRGIGALSTYDRAKEASAVPHRRRYHGPARLAKTDSELNRELRHSKLVSEIREGGAYSRLI